MPVLMAFTVLSLCASLVAGGESQDSIQKKTLAHGEQAVAAPDRDHDGIVDSLDRCPDEPETVNFFQDEDGCPDEKPDPLRNGPILGLVFSPGSEKPDSTRVLDSMATLLKFYPGTRLELRGHTDDVESRQKARLSLLRAEFVKNYLDSLGVSPDRIKASGVGDKQPMNPNRSGSARMLNRRVEVYVQ